MFEDFQVLLVDDDEMQLESLGDILEQAGFAVAKTSSGRQALELVKQKIFNLVISDLVMPGIGGLELLKHINESHKGLPVILITAHGTVESAIEALKMGAVDYLKKPYSPEELKLIVKREFERQRLIDRNAYFMSELSRQYNLENIVGKSPAMLEIFRKVQDISDSEAPVLITGESGTGKELIARCIHYSSPRQCEPFIPVSCAALAPGVLESELFGHEKGAFTGAIRTKIGRLEQANKGTLFLDEIGDTPQFIQVKLLRVLQFYEFERVGGDKTIKSDFRLICATNQNLGEKITAGAFRDDLFYRINVFEIEMPPLRERKDDLPLLLSHFVQIFNEKTNRRVIGFSPEAMQVLNDYDWPGNLRELKNLVERVFVYCKDSLVGLKDLPPNVLSKSPASETNFLPLPLWNLDNIEKIVIEKCFAQCSYNITKTAELLGITRSTLYSKLKKHGIFSAEEDESV